MDKVGKVDYGEVLKNLETLSDPKVIGGVKIFGIRQIEPLVYQFQT